jgi:hypothetical protein
VWLDRSCARRYGSTISIPSSVSALSVVPDDQGRFPGDDPGKRSVQYRCKRTLFHSIEDLGNVMFSMMRQAPKTNSRLEIKSKSSIPLRFLYWAQPLRSLMSASQVLVHAIRRDESPSRPILCEVQWCCRMPCVLCPKIKKDWSIEHKD